MPGLPSRPEGVRQDEDPGLERKESSGTDRSERAPQEKDAGHEIKEIMQTKPEETAPIRPEGHPAEVPRLAIKESQQLSNPEVATPKESSGPERKETRPQGEQKIKADRTQTPKEPLTPRGSVAKVLSGNTDGSKDEKVVPKQASILENFQPPRCTQCQQFMNKMNERQGGECPRCFFPLKMGSFFVCGTHRRQVLCQWCAGDPRAPKKPEAEEVKAWSPRDVEAKPAEGSEAHGEEVQKAEVPKDGVKAVPKAVQRAQPIVKEKEKEWCPPPKVPPRYPPKKRPEDAAKAPASSSSAPATVSKHTVRDLHAQPKTPPKAAALAVVLPEVNAGDKLFVAPSFKDQELLDNIGYVIRTEPMIKEIPELGKVDYWDLIGQGFVRTHHKARSRKFNPDTPTNPHRVSKLAYFRVTVAWPLDKFSVIPEVRYVYVDDSWDTLVPADQQGSWIGYSVFVQKPGEELVPRES